MKLKQMLKDFKFKWSVHGVGLAMAIGFLIGSSALVPGELSKRMFGQEDSVVNTDCSAFASRALDLANMDTFFSGGSGSPIGFDAESARAAGYSEESVSLASDIAVYADTYARSNRGDDLPEKTSRIEWLFNCGKEQVASVAEAMTEAAEEDDVSVLSACTDAGYQPHMCTCGVIGYPQPHGGSGWSTLTSHDNPHQYLLGEGYHEIFFPYSGQTDPNVRDYTRPRTWNSSTCGNNTYRDHGKVVTNSHYKEQVYFGWSPNGEPNPEVFISGPWPYVAWPAYVLWWHYWY